MDPISLENLEKQLEVRRLTIEDFDDLEAMQLKCFPGMPTWTREYIESQIAHFPEGQLVLVYNGRLVASSCSLMVDYDLCSEWHDWKKVSDSGYIRNHDPNGDVLYGIEIMVHPDFRGMRLARRLYDERKKIARERNLEAIVIGGRIPGYADHKEDLTAHEYARKVADKTLYDPVLTTQIANGFELKQLIPDYLPSDEDSVGWASHMEWVNVDYRPHQKRQIRPVQIVRLATVQYQMRAIESWEEFERQITYFVDTAGDYRCDFVTFPELFTTQLLSLVKARRPGSAARELAEFNERYIKLFQKLSVSYHVNIIGGSNFAIEDEKLYNIAYLFRRDGTIGKQYKIHITPAEWRWWGVTGGNKVEVFDTDCGRIAILICYDIEFPELARIAAKKGAQVIFVPFNTDERYGYLRVRNVRDGALHREPRLHGAVGLHRQPAAGRERRHPLRAVGHLHAGRHPVQPRCDRGRVHAEHRDHHHEGPRHRIAAPPPLRRHDAELARSPHRSLPAPLRRRRRSPPAVAATAAAGSRADAARSSPRRWASAHPASTRLPHTCLSRSRRSCGSRRT